MKQWSGPPTAIKPRGHRRYAFLSRLGVITSLSVYLSASALARPDQGTVTFAQYQIDTGSDSSQTVLAGFFSGANMADLAVIDGGERRFRLFCFDQDDWAPALDTKLGPEVAFVDVANIDGRDRLITYRPGRLEWFDPESATEHPLLEVTSSFHQQPGGGIPQVDITRDVNGDGRDDLVVPGSDGFWLFVQTREGRFADPVKIGRPLELRRILADPGYRFDPWGESRVHQVDYNLDGRTDLVFWNQDHFKVHLQRADGQFARKVGTFTTEVAFDSDDLASLAAPYGVRRRRMDHNPGGAMTGRVLHSLTDLNGDGVADLVVFSLQGGGLWSMRSTYEVHFGTPSGAGIVFAPDASTVIRSDGIPFELGQHDFEHDGQIDLMITVLNPGILKAMRMIVSALLTQSVSMDLKFYSMEDGSYPGKATAKRQIRTVSFGKSGEKAANFPAVLIGDVSGDQRCDLLVQDGRKQLRVFLGSPGPELFSRRPQKLAVAMPAEEGFTWLADLNQDRKRDLVVHNRSTGESNRLTLLIAQ